MTPPVVILGCGYTGRRVAARLRARGADVFCTSRTAELRFDALESLEPLRSLPKRARVVYSIPALEPDPTGDILGLLEPSRVVYLSTTGVYGDSVEVDENTSPSPTNPEGEARVRAEQAVLSGPWSSIVLRPAAIYGPGRGVHMRMQLGTFRLGGDGSNYVSRIHVEDLAAHVESALFSDLGGAWPVADEAPATSREIAQFCSELLHVPMPASVPAGSLHHTRRANRRVNGSAVRARLGVTLTYPSYREGIPASLIAGYTERD